MGIKIIKNAENPLIIKLSLLKKWKIVEEQKLGRKT